ncbi:hypothetical protein QVD17_40795 [Tagetes erecta]|uniref:C2H2-type domain-containing protein n=1 Tax=Tagetes erecta TaxID=13708 RepID=A0AAD8JSA1_TARER|nr:hypothetical protein QVD17_40795 [Tagetes erecta]
MKTKFNALDLFVCYVELGYGLMKKNTRYECKTCKKRFDTYQALGGHQGTHKKVQISTNDACLLNLDIVAPESSGLHRCKTCMKGFATGQALGGHMRRHRVEKALILIKKQQLYRQQAVEKAESDLVLAAVGLQRLKTESDLVLAAAGLQQLKAEDDKRYGVKSELVLAAQEWRLSI